MNNQVNKKGTNEMEKEVKEDQGQNIRIDPKELKNEIGEYVSKGWIGGIIKVSLGILKMGGLVVDILVRLVGIGHDGIEIVFQSPLFIPDLLIPQHDRGQPLMMIAQWFVQIGEPD
jgi:hypothetical protein